MTEASQRRKISVFTRFGGACSFKFKTCRPDDTKAEAIIIWTDYNNTLHIQRCFIFSWYVTLVIICDIMFH